MSKKHKKSQKKIMAEKTLLDKINRGLEYGDFHIIWDAEGEPKIQSADITKRMSCNGKVFESEQNAILSSIDESLFEIRDHADSIAKSLAIIASHVEKIPQTGCIIEAEPLKMFPDDTLRELIDGIVKTNLSAFKIGECKCKHTEDKEVDAEK